MNSLFDTEQYSSTHYGHNDYEKGSVSCNHHWTVTLNLDNLPIRRCKHCCSEETLKPCSDAREIYQSLIKQYESRLHFYQACSKDSPKNDCVQSDDYKELKAVVDSLWQYIGIDPDREGTLLFDRVREQVVREQVVREQSVREQSVREQVVREQVVREQVVREQVVREQVVREQENCTLTNGHWIEEKKIKRGNKVHGPYRYERWRDIDGKLKSKYLGKV